jgi:uncharacterized protein
MNEQTTGEQKQSAQKLSATRTRLMNDMKEAMKARNSERLVVIRMLITEIKNAEINDAQNQGRERTEPEAIALVAAYHKNLVKTLAEFPPDRQTALKAELKIVEEYLPAQLSPEQVKSEILSALNNTSERNFGVLMKTLQPHFSGRAEGRLISETLKALLAQL